MLVTSKQFEEYKKAKDLEIEILNNQMEQIRETFMHMSKRIDDIVESLEPPAVMGGK